MAAGCATAIPTAAGYAPSQSLAVFRWNPGAGRYIASSGQFVPKAAVRASLDTALDAQMQRVSEMSDRLVSGSISLADWQQGMTDAIKTAHLEGLVVARGGWAQLTPADHQWVSQRISGELAYLQNFKDQIASGDQALTSQVANRAEMYVEAGRGTNRAAEQQMAVDRGDTMERNMLGSSQRSCAECPDLTDMDWVPIGTLPEPGSRKCGSRCHCYIATRGKGGH